MRHKILLNLMAEYCKVLLRDLCDDSNVFILKEGSPLALGRNRETRITDTRCSRVQLLLTPNVGDGSVIVEQRGSNSSAINGVKLRKGEKRKAYNDDIVEVLESKHFFKLEIELKPGEASGSKQTEHSIQSNGNKKHKGKTNAASLDHFLKDSALEPLGTWKSVSRNSLVVFTSNGMESRKKIASFDLDGTLICTVSGNVFAKDFNDWKIAFPNVVDKLKELYDTHHKIVLFTNQSGIGRGKIRLSDFKKKIEAIVRKLTVPVQVFIATMDDIYRKPRPGMWQYFVEHENDNLEISYDESFYCGDAAGRPANCELNKKKKDFSVSDRLFALNLNLKFFTPEEYFLGWKTPPFQLPEFNPPRLPSNEPLLDPATSELVSKNQEIIVMIGCPGSGKTFFAKKYLEFAGYVHVNRDTLKTWQKCVSLTEKSVQNKLSVVVDNTSPDKESRARYTRIAKQYNIPVRAFWMKTTLEHAKHNNTFRQIKRDESHDFIPNHSLNGFFNILEPPTLEEGFTEIVRVNLIPEFKDEVDKKLYRMYLLD